MYRTYFLHTQQATTAHENWTIRGYQVIPFFAWSEDIVFFGTCIGHKWLVASLNRPSFAVRNRRWCRRRRFRTILASPPSRRLAVPRSQRAVFAKGGWYTGKLAAKLKKDIYIYISWKIHGKIIEVIFFWGGVAEFVDFFGRTWTWSLW